MMYCMVILITASNIHFNIIFFIQEEARYVGKPILFITSNKIQQYLSPPFLEGDKRL